MDILSWNYITEKWNHAGFQRYFKNTGWMFASRVLSMIISFITTTFIARRLGPGNFGQLSYAVSFVSIFSVISSLGIDNVLYRDLIKNPDKKREFLGSALIIKLVAGLFAVILVIISALLWVENDVSRILIVILSGTFLFNAFQIISYEFQARVQSKYPSIISLSVALILNVLKIVVIMSGKGVIYLAFLLLLESVLYAIFYLFAYKRNYDGKITDWEFNKNISVVLLKDSWPIIFTSAFALIYARIDQVLIKHLMDAENVGIYSSAVAIAEAWYFLPNIIMPSLFPAIVNAKQTSEEIYYSRIKRLAIFLLILSIGVAVFTTLLAPTIINVIYGPAFMNASLILKIYVWSSIGTFLGSLAINYLIAENRKKILAFITFVPMITNVILNLILIPKYGIVGSAYATLISYSLGPLSLLLFKEPRKIFTNKLK